jgi:hypothetical protein
MDGDGARPRCWYAPGNGQNPPQPDHIMVLFND